MTSSILLAVLLAASNAAAEPAAAPPPKPKKAVETRVWLNEDVEGLRAKPTITLFEVPAAEGSGEALAMPAEPPKERDPRWYVEQLVPLRAQIAGLDVQIRDYRQFRERGLGNYDGLVLGEDNIGITPESSVWLLENQRRELATRISELEDLARRNSIPPGVLRIQTVPPPEAAL